MAGINKIIFSRDMASTVLTNAESYFTSKILPKLKYYYY